MRETWAWNAEHHGEKRADNYEAFLYRKLSKLASYPDMGEALNEFAGLRRLLIQRKAGGYGHIAIYRVTEDLIQVLLLYHTSQNWQEHLRGEDLNH